MAYRYGNRKQLQLFPSSIGEYIPENDPVRAYDAFVEALNLRELGILLDEHHVGNSEYDPLSMLKLLVYGYSYGIRSSRKLERAVHHNLSFIWLVGGLKPDYKTISEFRRQNRLALAKILKQCARICLKLGLIEGNTIFVDGTKLRANASIEKNWSMERCKATLEQIDKRVERILKECDAADEEESGEKSMVKIPEKLANAEELKKQVTAIMTELAETDQKAINTTDPDSFKTKSSRGCHMGYNGQIAVDGKHGLIVNSEAISQRWDQGQLSRQAEEVKGTLGKSCEYLVADAGYFYREDFRKAEKNNPDIKVVVPQAVQVSQSAPVSRRDAGFTYDATRDCFICPEGHAMTRRNRQKALNRVRYFFRKKGRVCLACPRFGSCTKGKRGRMAVRYLGRRALVDKYMKQYEKYREIYRLRKSKVELPFGHIKKNALFDSFLLRKLSGVNAEMALMASGYNMTRIINLLGVKKLIARIAA
jgi:transposase